MEVLSKLHTWSSNQSHSAKWQIVSVVLELIYDLYVLYTIYILYLLLDCTPLLSTEATEASVDPPVSEAADKQSEISLEKEVDEPKTSLPYSQLKSEGV